VTLKLKYVHLSSISSVKNILGSHFVYENGVTSQWVYSQTRILIHANFLVKMYTNKQLTSAIRKNFFRLIQRFLVLFNNLEIILLIRKMDVGVINQIKPFYILFIKRKELKITNMLSTLIIKYELNEELFLNRIEKVRRSKFHIKKQLNLLYLIKSAK